MKLDEFVDWSKAPFTAEEAMAGMLRVAQKTDQVICNGNLSEKDKIQLHSNALDVIGMISNYCNESIVIEDFDEKMPLENLWKTLIVQFSPLEATVQNRKLFYIS